MSARPLVLGIAGSPRRGGNSETLLDAALAGAAGAGAATEKLAVAELVIDLRCGCDGCSETGECVITDGMLDAYALLDTADAVIVASPVYFATVPAVLKAFYDRMQPYWVRRYVLGEPVTRRRPGAVLLSRGGGDPFGADAAIATTKSVFACLGIDLLGELVAEDVDAAGDVERFPAVLVRARELGARVASAAMRAEKP